MKKDTKQTSFFFANFWSKLKAQTLQFKGFICCYMTIAKKQFRLMVVCVLFLSLFIWEIYRRENKEKTHQFIGKLRKGIGRIWRRLHDLCFCGKVLTWRY